MLTAAQVKELEGILKLPADALKKAIDDTKEVTVEIPKLKVYTEPEYETLETNLKADGKKDGVEEGKEAGKEIATKVIAKKVGLETTIKDVEKVADLILGKISADDASKETIKLLQKDVASKDKEIAKLTTEKESLSFETKLVTMLPAKRTSTMEVDEQVSILKNKLEFTAEGVKDKATGEFFRDDLKNILPEAKAIEKYYEKRGWLQADKADDKKDEPGGGRGGKDQPAGQTYKTQKEWRKDWEARNPDIPAHSEEGQLEFRKVLKDNPDIKTVDDGL